MADTFDIWFRSGRAAILAWAVLFVIYITCKLLKIDAEEITNAFVAVTGLVIGNLGMSQGRKSIQVSEDVDKLKEVAIKQHPETGDELNG